MTCDNITDICVYTLFRIKIFWFAFPVLTLQPPGNKISVFFSADTYKKSDTVNPKTSQLCIKGSNFFVTHVISQIYPSFALYLFSSLKRIGTFVSFSRTLILWPYRQRELKSKLWWWWCQKGKNKGKQWLHFFVFLPPTLPFNQGTTAHKETHRGSFDKFCYKKSLLFVLCFFLTWSWFVTP